MRIKSVNILKNTNPATEDGLGEIKMDRLQQVVLLAGKTVVENLGY